jgi:hypothetical protein
VDIQAVRVPARQQSRDLDQAPDWDSGTLRLGHQPEMVLF